MIFCFTYCVTSNFSQLLSQFVKVLLKNLFLSLLLYYMQTNTEIQEYYLILLGIIVVEEIYMYKYVIASAILILFN